MQQISNVITNMSTEKWIKEEKSELKHKLESMEEKDDSREVNISDLPNLHKQIPSTAQDEQPPLELFEEVPAGEFNEAMMKEGANLHEIPFPSFVMLWCYFVTKITV